MTTIDEIGRRAGRDALADAEPLADADAGLDRLFAESATDAGHGPEAGAGRCSQPSAPWPQERWVSSWCQDAEPDPATPAATTSAVPSTTAAPSTVAPSTTAAPSTTTAPSTTAAPSTTPVADTLGVSYLSPPPMLAPDAFATITVAEPSSVAVAPSGAVVAVDVAASTASVVDPDGSIRMPLDVALPYLAAAGPGDVVYGLMDGDALPVTASIVAIALSGERAGEVVASAPVDPNTYTELPIGAFGLGPTGVVDRTRQIGAELIGYVDAAGRPIAWPGTPPPLITIDGDDTVRTSDGLVWPLRIERHPNWLGESYVGESPPAAAPNGGATLWTSLGPPANDADFRPPTMPVVAELAADGSARWHQNPDGWAVATSDVGGTILTGRDGDRLQLARSGPAPHRTPARWRISPT